MQHVSAYWPSSSSFAYTFCKFLFAIVTSVYRFESSICFWVVGLERGPLSLVRITEELLEWKSSGSGLGTEINGQGYSLRWSRNTLCPLNMALTSPTSGGRSVGIVRLRTRTTEFVFCFIYKYSTVIGLIAYTVITKLILLRLPKMFCQIF
jgi:hypothetical protein